MENDFIAAWDFLDCCRHSGVGGFFNIKSEYWRQRFAFTVVQERYDLPIDVNAVGRRLNDWRSAFRYIYRQKNASIRKRLIENEGKQRNFIIGYLNKYPVWLTNLSVYSRSAQTGDLLFSVFCFQIYDDTIENLNAQWDKIIQAVKDENRI